MMNMVSHRLLTPDQQSDLANPLQSSNTKRRKLCFIILNLSEENIEKFFKCLEDTGSDYLPHEQLLKKLRSGRYVVM